MSTIQRYYQESRNSQRENVSRRDFLKIGAAGGAILYLCPGNSSRLFAQADPSLTLDPGVISKFVDPLVKPPAMPSSDKNYYEIAVREFPQQILPAGMPSTTVWSYGSVNHEGTFNYPAFTIEAKVNKSVRVKWINQLDGLPHLLPVDATLHWANPIGDRDSRPPADPNAEYWKNPLLENGRYVGPVPMVTHVHGAHTYQESDGYPEAWYLAQGASKVNGIKYTTGTFYDHFESTAAAPWGSGFAVFEYPNKQRATTLWYHDHTLGMTRLNVYAGPAGFYLIRGGSSDLSGNKLPGPAPEVGADPFGTYYEIPLAIQDRSFNSDGSLFYPDNRAFFEGLDPGQLQIPFYPYPACGGEPSDVAPIWQPEFFGNTMVVNGRTWPYLEVEPRRYRFRLLNGCNSRFLILAMDNDMPFYQIGAEGGFLPAPVTQKMLLMSPAERADVIVDFTNIKVGTNIVLLNAGPDGPFSGTLSGTPADPATTGQVMQFRVVAPAGKPKKDKSDPPAKLKLPKIKRLGAADKVRQVSLNEEISRTVFVTEDENGNIALNCDSGTPFGPTAALLGTVGSNGSGTPLLWSDLITENPAVGATEVWEIYNFTVDAHPIHIHVVQFEVVDRQPIAGGAKRPPEPAEMGFKDTVIAYPGEITRIKAKFDIAGLFVWHCHIVEHEDNEMMRPFGIG